MAGATFQAVFRNPLVSPYLLGVSQGASVGAAWADVPAVKNGKIIKNPVGTFNWDRYSAEEALQILWAAKLFHPEKFTDIDLVKETREFYSTFYGYNLTEDEAQHIINGEAPATN
nr:iron chelate uptake ABC transporter family permease subunit [uncultured Rothia sp.]